MPEAEESIPEADLVSVVVPTLGRESLRPLLLALEAQETDFPFEVVLVPQGELDPALPIAPNVRVVHAEDGRGYAHVRNVGLAAARGDPICFVDDDALPRPDWLARITDGIRRGAWDGATADLRVALGRGTVADAISLLGFPGGAAAGWRTMWPVAGDGFTEHLCTGNCTVSRRAVEALGGFDEGLADGSEDVDLGDRLTAGGFRIAYVEDAVVAHDARSGVGAFFRWHLRRGRSAYDISKRRRVGGHVTQRLHSSWRILRRSLFTRHGPAVLGLLALQYAAQGLGFLQARAGHRPGLRRTAPGTRTGRGAPPEVTVVIPTLNREHDLARCLRALRRQTYSRFDVLVVDNGSTDGTAAVVAAAAAMDGRVRAVREGTPGLGHARNRGIREAQGSVIAFLDDDAVPPPGWLEALVPAFDDPRVGGCGGPARPLWEAPPHDLVERSRRARAFLGEFDRGSRAKRVSWMIGANGAYRREVFETCGPFRTDADRIGKSLRSGGDVEMGLRASRRWILRYEPAAWVDHGVAGRKLSWGYLAKVAFAIGRARGEEPRGPSEAPSGAPSLLDLALGAVSAVGWLVGLRDRAGSAPPPPGEPPPTAAGGAGNPETVLPRLEPHR
jgi:GT2 family glycosyltransferase